MSSRITPAPLPNVFKYSDIVLALAVVTIVMMMMIPLPTWVLDILLSFNITFSLVILLVSMYTSETLQFSVFPSILLLTTLFRLALNVSSTRLILLHGEAGQVIYAFGNFVVGGNAVVGFIVFLILVIIQFIVITKGAERVAEVAARFTLDGMPGKQMSIDADLNAGIITEQQARQRREEIQREADFYGAMDGASKFVKGDAIAGIIIIIINIFGGFFIGVIQNGMTILQALQRYTLLTVGDGLVCQIPALLISTATGIIVTRAASDSNLGYELVSQILSRPRALFITSAVLVFLAVIPGLPHLPFIVLALFTGFVGYSTHKANQEIAQQEMMKAREQASEEVKKPESVVSLLQVDPMELEIGYSLIPLADPNQSGDLLDRIVMVRRQCALELGLIVPTIRIRDNMQLRPNTYVIKIRNIEVAQGEILIDHLLAMDSGMVNEKIDGIETTEPAFGLPALWIHESLREKAELAGYTVVDPPSIIATHLTEVIRGHADELLGRQEVQTLLDTVKQTSPAVVEELVPQLLTLGEVQKVLGNLLHERISIRDLVTILETLADYARTTKDLDVLTEYVRQSLSRYISKTYAGSQGVIHVLTLDPQLEQTINQSIQRGEHGAYLAMEPNLAQQIFHSLINEMQKMMNLGYQPIVLCAPLVRLYFKRLTERVAPNLVVLSYNELDPKIEVQTVGMVMI